MIPRPSAGDVQKLAFRIVGTIQFGIFAHVLDALLRGDERGIAGYDGDVAKALAAYNAGPGRVDSGRWQNIGETRNYVERIMADAGLQETGAKEQGTGDRGQGPGEKPIAHDTVRVSDLAKNERLGDAERESPLPLVEYAHQTAGGLSNPSSGVQAMEQQNAGAGLRDAGGSKLASVEVPVNYSSGTTWHEAAASVSSGQVNGRGAIRIKNEIAASLGERRGARLLERGNVQILESQEEAQSFIRSLSDEGREAGGVDARLTAQEAQTPLYSMEKYARSKLAGLIERFKNETARDAVSGSLSEEQTGIRETFTGQRQTAEIRKNDLDSLQGAITLEQTRANKQGYGTAHILLRHYGQDHGNITAREILEMGEVIRRGETKEADGKRIYQLKENGVRFRVIVGKNEAGNTVISFYSNRNRAALAGDAGNRPSRPGGVQQGQSNASGATTHVTALLDNVENNKPGVKYSEDGKIQGFTTVDGRVYLVADGIAEGRSMGILAHELGVHARRLGFSTDEQWQGLMTALERMSRRDSPRGKAVQEAMARVPENTAPGHYWEEVAAYMVEEHGAGKIPVVDRIIAHLKGWLNRVGIMAADKFTSKDLAAFARAAVAAEATEGGRQRTDSRANAAANTRINAKISKTDLTEKNKRVDLHKDGQQAENVQETDGESAGANANREADGGRQAADESSLPPDTRHLEPEQADETGAGTIRFSWAKDFPPVTINTSVAAMRAHPDYQAAKNQANREAARSLVVDLAKTDRLLAVAEKHPSAIIVPVHAEEAGGKNQIPSALADYMGAATGLDVDTKIVQSSLSSRTAISDRWQRLVNRPAFDGPVTAGREYILTDDVVTQGGTLASLKTYNREPRRQGGRYGDAGRRSGRRPRYCRRQRDDLAIGREIW